jgi:hypothetical protein
MPTLTTIPALILILLLWRWTRGNVVAIVAFTSIFDAASVLNFGTLCVSPWLLALVLSLSTALFQGRLRTRVDARINRSALTLLLAFLAWSALSGLVCPLIFAGTPVVHGITMVPLAWGLPNIAQLCYLAAAAVIFYLTITSTPQQISIAITWYLRGCIVAAVFAIYQLANAVAHIPFPTAILYSNTAHAVYHAYQINGMWRLNSTFTEASDMAGSLIGGLGILAWDLMHRRITPWRVSAFALLFTAILMTLSTTGYLCLALMIVIGIVMFAHRVLKTRGIEPIKLVLFILLLTGISTTIATSSFIRTKVSNLISSVVLDKRNSSSFQDREGSHDQALQALRDTSYMGAGLGSTRASGVGYTLLASTGIVGFTLFTLAFVAIFLPWFRSGRTHPGHAENTGPRTLLALSLLLTSMVISGTEPIAPVLWMLLGAALFCWPASQRFGAVHLSSNSFARVTHPQISGS